MTDLPTFDEFVDVFRRRLFDADALDRSKLHDVHELMSDYAGRAGVNWYEDAFDELEAQGHLDPAASKGMGPTMGARLSADGRAYVRQQQEQEEDAPEQEDD